MLVGLHSHLVQLALTGPIDVANARSMRIPQLRWTGHDARAGWATHMWLAGTEFGTLREMGRWASDALCLIREFAYYKSLDVPHILCKSAGVTP